MERDTVEELEIVETVDVEEVDAEIPAEEEAGEQVEKPFWLQEEDVEEVETGKTVPLAVLLKEKAKRKERDTELDDLRQQIEELKKGGTAVAGAAGAAGQLKRPRINDFDTDEAYEIAMDAWEQQQRDQLIQTVDSRRDSSKANQRVQQEVETFYTNAEKMLKEHAISPEVYVSASNNIIDSLDRLHPGQGKAMFHALVATVGDHAEKIVFHVGRNKTALAEFNSQLLADPSGSRALVYLGSLKAKVSGETKKSSRAPAPSVQLNGGSGNGKGEAERKKYEAAHKKGNVQQAYNIKSAARKAGIDVTSWR